MAKGTHSQNHCVFVCVCVFVERMNINSHMHMFEILLFRILHPQTLYCCTSPLHDVLNIRLIILLCTAAARVGLINNGNW